jgi:hypothetical protein
MQEVMKQVEESNAEKRSMDHKESNAEKRSKAKRVMLRSGQWTTKRDPPNQEAIDI